MAFTQQGSTSDAIRETVAAALAPERRRFIVTAAARDAQQRAEAAYRQEFGRAATADIVVSGRAVADLGGLDPDQGEVAFRFDRVSEALVWIYDQLVTHSPRLTGAYAGAHVLLADDQAADPRSPPPAERYVFVNTQPYAKKIERWRAPGGVYEAVAALAARRFGNSVRVGFGYESPISAYIAGEVGRGRRARLRAQPTRLAGMRLERSTRVPAIVVVPA